MSEFLTGKIRAINESGPDVTYDVILHPTGEPLKGVQPILPTNLVFKYPVDSLVLVWRPDNFTSKIIQLLEDPVKQRSAKGRKADKHDRFEPGEVYIASHGKASLYLSGKLGDKPAAKLSAGPKERISLDFETETSDIRGSNIIIQNVPTVPTSMSKISITEGNTLTIGLETPPMSNVYPTKIEINALGKITLESLLGTVEIQPTGQIQLKGLASTVTLMPTGSITVEDFLLI